MLAGAFPVAIMRMKKLSILTHTPKGNDMSCIGFASLTNMTPTILCSKCHFPRYATFHDEFCNERQERLRQRYETDNPTTQVTNEE